MKETCEDMVLRFPNIEVSSSYDGPRYLPEMDCPICKGGAGLHIDKINQDGPSAGADWNRTVILNFICESLHCRFDVGFYNHKGGMYLQWSESKKKCDCPSCHEERHFSAMREYDHSESQEVKTK